MNLIHGVHEVRLFRPTGVAAGYFDNWEDALRAIENEPSQYKAAYITLNPIRLPDSLPLNPQTLTPSKTRRVIRTLPGVCGCCWTLTHHAPRISIRQMRRNRRRGSKLRKQGSI